MDSLRYFIHTNGFLDLQWLQMLFIPRRNLNPPTVKIPKDWDLMKSRRFFDTKFENMGVIQ